MVLQIVRAKSQQICDEIDFRLSVWRVIDD